MDANVYAHNSSSVSKIKKNAFKKLSCFNSAIYLFTKIFGWNINEVKSILVIYFNNKCCPFGKSSAEVYFYFTACFYIICLNNFCRHSLKSNEKTI